MQAEISADPILNRLQKLHPKLIDLGLDRTIALSQALGSPHEELPPVIHVAGTNGKGSVTAFIRAFAEAAGLRVHIYNSPHLCSFRERIRIAGELISTKALISLLERCEKANANKPITFFEITTVAAFLGFAETPADLLVLETGLGGQYDSTNIIPDTACSVMTPIARDHEHFLGTNLTQIATQKAGIMRPHRPTIWAQQDAEAAKVLDDTAHRLSSVSYRAGEAFSWEILPEKSWIFCTESTSYNLPRPSLIGAHQYDNAALALMALLCSETLPDEQITEALSGAARAVWPGRIQNLSGGQLSALFGNVPLWLDGAHNQHGAEALSLTLDALCEEQGYPENGWQVIYGALDTRPPEQFLTVLASHITALFCITIEGQDAALPATMLAAKAGSLGLKAHACCTLKDALSKCNERHPVLICGSLYLAGQVLRENGTLPD